MSSVAILHSSARPDDGQSHDRTSVRVHKSNVQREVADWDARGWQLDNEEKVWVERPMPGGIGGVPTDFVTLAFARPKLTMRDGLVEWHRPTNEPESPINVLPAIVMGQFADGPYQLFVCSFQGAHIQVAPATEIVPMPRADARDGHATELMRSIAKDWQAVRDSYDVTSRHGILMEGEISGLKARAEVLESKVSDLEEMLTRPVYTEEALSVAVELLEAKLHKAKKAEKPS